MNSIRVIDPTRIRKLNQLSLKNGPVVYWMKRDQRVRDNWALLYAQQLALKLKTDLYVVFCLTSDFLGATWRQYDFMIQGLMQVENDLTQLGISFQLVEGKPEESISNFLKRKRAGALVTDFSPLRISRNWIDTVKRKCQCAFFEVDAHNIVPCWIASKKQEYAARFFRPKIRSQLNKYLTAFPQPKKMPNTGSNAKKNKQKTGIDWETILSSLNKSKNVPPVFWIKSGSKYGMQRLHSFLSHTINHYSRKKNDPTQQVTSCLSSYLHFGQVSPQRVALETQSCDAFFEEVVVRRELADNYCFYNRRDFPAASCGRSHMMSRRRRDIIKECQSTLKEATTKLYFCTI